MALPVFVLHWNRPAECARTVRELSAQGLPIALTVIDNGSDAEAVAGLRSALPAAAKVVALPENLGWGAAFNRILKPHLESSAAGLCVICAHDALPAPGCLSRLVDAMNGQPRLGIACPQYENPFIARFSPVRGVTFTSMEPGPDGSVIDVDVPHGTLMILRAECLRDAGLFDERYFAYGDEAEIGLRARLAGWRVAMVRGAVVVNPGTSTPSAAVGYLYARNSLLMARTHGGRLRAWSRAMLILANAARMRLVASQHALFPPAARLMGIRDYFLGRWGAPPSSLLQRASEVPAAQAGAARGSENHAPGHPCS
jgi:N-acetylglucosaminyl-diphospho-decaprenol L-rhamnosyltransferase